MCFIKMYGTNKECTSIVLVTSNKHNNREICEICGGVLNEL